MGADVCAGNNEPRVCTCTSWHTQHLSRVGDMEVLKCKYLCPEGTGQPNQETCFIFFPEEVGYCCCFEEWGEPPGE